MAFALGLSLIFGSLILGSFGAGSSASAEEPASVFPGSVFYGRVFADSSGALPDRVRALGPAGTVCGSSEVVPVDTGVGTYAVTVVSLVQKSGCPDIGAVVQFSLLFGPLDDGVWADEVRALAFDAGAQPLDLHPAFSYAPGWAGRPGNVSGGSLLHWTGTAISFEAALALLPFPVGTTYRLDPILGLFVEVTSVSETLSVDDLALVRFQ